MANSGAFLQSNEWQKFQESLGRKTWRIDDILIIKMPLLFGFCYLYSPKLNFRFQISDFRFIEQIKKIAERERAIFWRVEPAEAPPKEFIKTKNIQPRCTLITDISKPENELLVEMHEKTRYNIRLAERKGVKCLQLTAYSLQLFEQFYKLLGVTSKRQNIKLHSKEYYKKLLNCSDNNLRGRASYCNELFIAYFDNQPIAGAMVNLYENTATYLHGGSVQEQKNEKTKEQKNIKGLMAPYLLHWEIIKYAKAQGFHYYDWWGINPEPGHKWAGITRFKRGFGGKEICAPGTYDFPINKIVYALYRLTRRRR